MKLCRNCEEWETTAQWYGNCPKHPFWQDQASEYCEPNQDCQGKDFIDKYEKYKNREGVTVV